MSVAIRSAEPGDGKIIWELMRELAGDQQELDQFKATPADFEQALFGPNAVCGCEIALIEGKPAGQAFWHRSFSVYRGKSCLYIESLFVRERHRRQGIARLLLHNLARTAQRQGFAVIYWLMMEGNAAGRRLYEGIGAQFETGICFYRLKDEALRKLAAE
jgi:GNAT superfamily N-acetyltransferase